MTRGFLLKDGKILWVALSAKIFAAFLILQAGKVGQNLAESGGFEGFRIFSTAFNENLPYPLRHFPYSVSWFPYAVGRRNKEISQQPYCIGAQKGGMDRSLPFVRGFVGFVRGEK